MSVQRKKHHQNKSCFVLLPYLWCRMRDAARKMEEKHFADRTTEHVEFLPVEWRSKLALDGGMLDLNEGHLYTGNLQYCCVLNNNFKCFQ